MATSARSLSCADGGAWPLPLFHPDVLLPNRLDSYLTEQRRSGFGERILGSVIQWCLDTESADVVMDGYFSSLTPDRVAAIRNALDRLGTWDSLRYYGSRIETGDLIRLCIGGVVVPREQISSRCSCSVRWTRNKTWGLIKALTGGWPLGRLELPNGPRPIRTGDYVFFHRAGDPAPCQIPLLGLDGFTLG